MRVFVFPKHLHQFSFVEATFFFQRTLVSFSAKWTYFYYLMEFSFSSDNRYHRLVQDAQVSVTKNMLRDFVHSTFQCSGQCLFGCYCIPSYCSIELIPDTWIRWVKVWTISRPMVFVDKPRKIVSAPLLQLCVDVWHRFRNVVAIFQSNWKHLPDVSSMIGCSFLENYYRWYVFKTHFKPNQHFFGKLSFLSNTPLMSAWETLASQIKLFWKLHIPLMSNIFSSEKGGIQV